MSPYFEKLPRVWSGQGHALHLWPWFLQESTSDEQRVCLSWGPEPGNELLTLGGDACMFHRESVMSREEEVGQEREKQKSSGHCQLLIHVSSTSFQPDSFLSHFKPCISYMGRQANYSCHTWQWQSGQCKTKDLTTDWRLEVKCGSCFHV